MVGMILGSPAQVAGVEQGDQLLQVDSMQVDGQSPFQAASAISGSDAEPDAVPEPIVHLQVHGCLTVNSPAYGVSILCSASKTVPP